jgi:alkanesulfonate monooxygenase SsuD/methylene tetrahydromethanopterin reductase-like flavin-dependent oxidoreductase (luciferase family)
VRFGTFQLHSIPPWTNGYDVVQQQFDQMLAAERNGFYELWLAEHNGRAYGAIGNTVGVATALAAATTRIRIATAVSRLPLHHPMHLAEDLAYADILSQGRIDWGVGKGYDKLEFATYDVPFEEREERWQETFDAVNQLWRTGSTEFNGKFFTLGPGDMVPMPLQRPTLPVYVMVSGSERSIQLAAKNLLPIASGSGPTPEELRQRLDLYAEKASAAGHPDDKIREVLARCWQLKPVHVGETTERAIVEYRQGLEWYMKSLANRSMFGFAREPKPYEYFVEHQSVLLGSPEKIAEDLADYCERSGIDNVICWVNMGGQPHAQVMAALDRMGEYIVPKLENFSYGWTSSAESIAPAAVTAIASV